MQLLNIFQKECVIADTFISLKVSKKQQSSAYKKVSSAPDMKTLLTRSSSHNM